jgi:hypothetical protein
LHDKEFKRLTKSGTKELVFTLDAEDPTWDAKDGEERFLEEVRKRLPSLVRNVREQKGRVQRIKEVELRRKERQYFTDTRNNLTNFPHKDLEIEVKNGTAVRIREIKGRLRDGSVSPETLVRYGSDKDWVELGEFLDERIKRRATVKQIDYLDALQKQHGINAEIAVDSSRKEISQRIAALVAKKGWMNCRFVLSLDAAETTSQDCKRELSPHRECEASARQRFRRAVPDK